MGLVSARRGGRQGHGQRTEVGRRVQHPSSHCNLRTAGQVQASLPATATDRAADRRGSLPCAFHMLTLGAGAAVARKVVHHTLPGPKVDGGAGMQQQEVVKLGCYDAVGLVDGGADLRTRSKTLSELGKGQPALHISVMAAAAALLRVRAKKLTVRFWRASCTSVSMRLTAISLSRPAHEGTHERWASAAPRCLTS